MDIKKIYDVFLQTSEIVTDTRKILPNSLFFALKGANFNGNAFAIDALKKGAKYAIIDEDIKTDNPNLIFVSDVLTTLQELANYHRKQLKIPIIGITGTNGKTTTKELLLTTLSQKYKTIATEGNLNNHIGVPLTLLKIKEYHEIAIIEMGANHLGEIADLCQIAEPNYGLVTNVGKAHLEGFGSLENIIKTKSALYEYVASTGGINFILNENTDLLSLLQDYNFIKYSCENISISNYGTGTVEHSFLTFHLKQLQSYDIEETHIKTQMVGLYNQFNILASITIAHHFGVSVDKIKKALEDYTPNNNRSQLKLTFRNKLILDAYNANPTSVQNAIENLIEIKYTQKLIILADMLELGEYSLQEHQGIVNLLMHTEINTILIGTEFSKTNILDSKYITQYNTVQDFIDSNIPQQVNDTLILIKGSRGMKLEILEPYL